MSITFEQTDPKLLHYLPLLNLGQDADVAIACVADALHKGDAQPWVTAMLADSNWRPHLVGAVAMLLDQRAILDPAPLWVPSTQAVG